VSVIEHGSGLKGVRIDAVNRDRKHRTFLGHPFGRGKRFDKTAGPGAARIVPYLMLCVFLAFCS
jgi:hypothetical protein